MFLLIADFHTHRAGRLNASVLAAFAFAAMDGKHRILTLMPRAGASKLIDLSTVLAQDHFYSDFLSLSLTFLTQKGSLMMTYDCWDMEQCSGFKPRAG